MADITNRSFGLSHSWQTLLINHSALSLSLSHTHTHTHTHTDQLYDPRALITELQSVTTIKLRGKWSLTYFSKP